MIMNILLLLLLIIMIHFLFHHFVVLSPESESLQFPSRTSLEQSLDFVNEIYESPGLKQIMNQLRGKVPLLLLSMLSAHICVHWLGMNGQLIEQ